MVLGIIISKIRWIDVKLLQILLVGVCLVALYLCYHHPSWFSFQVLIIFLSIYFLFYWLISYTKKISFAIYIYLSIYCTITSYLNCQLFYLDINNIHLTSCRYSSSLLTLNYLSILLSIFLSINIGSKDLCTSWSCWFLTGCRTRPIYLSYYISYYL